MMQTVQVGAFTTSYEKLGSGPLLVLLHGWANTWEAWLPIIPTLADHFTLIIPDLPGFGQSEGPSDGWSILEYGRWLSDFLVIILNQYPSKQLFVAGHSFGGKIACWYVATHAAPHIDKLILIDASGIPEKLTIKQRTIATTAHIVPQHLKTLLPGTLRSRIYGAFHASDDYLQASSAQKATLRKILPEDLTDIIGNIDTSTLVLWGTHDHTTPLSAGLVFHHGIFGSELKTYNAGHFPHHDQARLVVADIIEFLERHHPVITSRVKHHAIRQSLTTKLAILQQSEYEYEKLRIWNQAQTTIQTIQPKEWTTKLKIIKSLTQFFSPFLGEDRMIHILTECIAFPQQIYFQSIIWQASLKLRRYQQHGLQTVVIAGSYAKTSTKNIITHVLSGSKKTLQTPGNINVLIGIARVILQDLQAEHEVFVVELGEYNPGDIVRFNRLLHPSHKILTPIGVAHLERFASPQALEKEFLSFLKTDSASISIVHEQNRSILERHHVSLEHVHWYGGSLIKNIEVTRSGTEFDVQFITPLHVYIPLLGAHNAVNTVPALLVANSQGISESAAIGRLRTLTPTHARFEPSLLEHNILVINNGYNSNPGTAIESLATLKSLPGSQKIVITPGFVEMGTAQEAANQAFGQQLATVCDYVCVVDGANEVALLAGLLKAGFASDHIVEANSELEAMEKLRPFIKPNAIILFENSLTEIYKK